MHLAIDRLDVGEIMVERRSERRLRLMLRYARRDLHPRPRPDHRARALAVEPIVGPGPRLLGMSWLMLSPTTTATRPGTW
jgi:hypothetical protein